MTTEAMAGNLTLGGSPKFDYPGAKPLEITGAPPDKDILDTYAKFRENRAAPGGSEQYLELDDATSGRFKALSDDKWVDHRALNAQTPTLRDGDEVKFIIMGAGYGGLMHAVRLIQVGFSAQDIRFVDNAGGWGGTWYWNQYPGLMCDVESSIYMPFLEETNHIPKHRYSYGPELKQHAERIAKQWELQGLFRTNVDGAEWDDESKRWHLKMTENRGPQPSIQLKVTAQFVIAANGFLNHPKVPQIRGLGDFEGPIFHTARWDYNVTGGSPGHPTLDGLKGKKVGIIGTGCTAVQVIPQVAKWAKELHVFQRTPIAVAHRGQQEIDPWEWKTSVATHQGWQADRGKNYCVWIQGWTAPHNLVNDEWTRLRSYSAFMGAPHEKPITPDQIPGHIDRLLHLDGPSAEARRQRVRDTVEDPAVAETLMPWYPTWCKRPTFHDDYYPTFNLPHVRLVDASGRGIEHATKRGLVVGGKEHQVDVLICSTGYRSPMDGDEPGFVANMVFKGRSRLSLSDKWRERGATTLHGWTTHGFPNLILGGYTQMGHSSNATYQIDQKITHVAHVLAEAHKRVGNTAALTIESTEDAEEAWFREIAKYAGWFAAFGVCKSEPATAEGTDAVSQEEAQKRARGAPYGQGLLVYKSILEQWRNEGNFKGVVFSS